MQMMHRSHMYSVQAACTAGRISVATSPWPPDAMAVGYPGSIVAPRGARGKGQGRRPSARSEASLKRVFRTPLIGVGGVLLMLNGCGVLKILLKLTLCVHR